LNEFAYFSHVVSKPFELESGNLGNRLQKKSFSGIGAYFAVLAKILVSSLKLVDGKKA